MGIWTEMSKNLFAGMFQTGTAFKATAKQKSYHTEFMHLSMHSCFKESFFQLQKGSSIGTYTEGHQLDSGFPASG